jgi:hypothetical protein
MGIASATGTPQSNPLSPFVTSLAKHAQPISVEGLEGAGSARRRSACGEAGHSN